MEGDNPSTRKRGGAPSKPPTFPSTAWGCRPKTPLLVGKVRVFVCRVGGEFCGSEANKNEHSVRWWGKVCR